MGGVAGKWTEQATGELVAARPRQGQGLSFDASVGLTGLEPVTGRWHSLSALPIRPRPMSDLPMGFTGPMRFRGSGDFDLRIGKDVRSDLVR